jgi:putative peptidoglycan lipid II flippase
MSLTLKRFFGVSSLTLGCRATGFLSIPILGAALGLTTLSDAYSVANVLPNIIFELVLGGLMGSVFLPLFAEMRSSLPADRYREEAASLCSTLMAALLAVSVAACLLAPWVVTAMTTRAPKDAEVHAKAAFFFRFFAFQIFFYGMSGLSAILLNLERKFALPAGAPMLNNLVVIVAAALFAVAPEWIGESGLAIATTGGVAAMALAQARGLRSAGLRTFGRIRWNHPALKRAAMLGAPLVLLTLVQQAGVTVRANLASSIEGGFTALQHVHRFFQLPYGLLAVTIFTLAMPGLAEVSARGDAEALREQARRAFRWSVAAMLPATIAYAALAPWLMRLLMSSGRMDAAGAELLGRLLFFQALAVFPFALSMLAVRLFYARQRTLEPTLLLGGVALLQIALNIALFEVAGLEGIALSALLANGVGAAIGLWLARRLLAGPIAPTRRGAPGAEVAPIAPAPIATA